MKIYFHDAFYQVYASDPAAASGRMEAITSVLEDTFPVHTAEPASDEMIARVHGKRHIEEVKSDRLLAECAFLAAGATVQAAEAALDGEAAFALVRPPGHHASPDSCWGFCYFNNIAVAIKHLFALEAIEKALILDFDLHFGDGTDNIFQGDAKAIYQHPESSDSETFMKTLRQDMESAGKVDIIGVSAGFDRGKDDWGDLLSAEDYRTIGTWIKDFSGEMCSGRRFGVLEGGYNHSVLGAHVLAFLEGMR